jgi:nitronate monooxygenase
MEYSGRAISNDFTNRWHGRESALEQALGGERDRYWKAAKAGDVSTAVVFAGEGLDMIHDIKPAGDILRTIVDDAETALKRTRNMVSDRQ